MTTRRVVALLALLFVVCLLVSLPAFSSNVRIVRLSYTEGTVRIDRNVGQGLERAILNMPITQGSRLETGEDGRVEVEFENGSTLRMSGPGSLVFRELSLGSRGDKVTYLEVENGLLYFDISHKGDDDFRITFTGHNVRVDHDTQFRLDIAETGSTLAVFKGEVALAGQSQQVVVKKDETLTLDPTDRNRYFLAKGITGAYEDTWDEQRRNYRDQYAQHDQDYQYANSYYGAPYSYGLADLSYYGSYFDMPGYGRLWRPYSLGTNWDPFNDGAWAWYPGQGWIFISSQPWGWTPYRYGQWLWVNGYGWCWAPARFYSIWNPVPVVRFAPRTFQPLIPPHTGSGPTVLIGGGFHTPGPGPTPPPRWPHRAPDDNISSGGGTPAWPGRGGTVGVTRPQGPDGSGDLPRGRDREGPPSGWTRPGTTPPSVRPTPTTPPRGQMDIERPPAPDLRRAPDTERSPRPDGGGNREIRAPRTPDLVRRDPPPQRVTEREPVMRREPMPQRDSSPRMSAPPSSAPASHGSSPRFGSGPR